MKMRQTTLESTSSAALERIQRACFETLEQRQMLSVTINNGLSSANSDFFEVVVDEGGSTRNTLFGGTDTIYDYFAYLDTGDAAGAHLLNNFGSPPVLGSDGFVRSSGTIDLDNGGEIAFTVQSNIPSGSKSYFNRFSFTATGFDLRNAKLFQYMDADIEAVGDDVLQVKGTTNGTGNNKLILTTIDPATDIRQSQSDGAASVNATFTGWAADVYSVLQDEIAAGGYDAPVAGFINTTNLPPTTVSGIGSVYGPTDITTALEYGFTNASTASVTTVLGIDTVVASEPEIDVQGNGVSVLSGDLAPATADGTDFGNEVVGVATTQSFAIRNIGTGSLALTGNPRVTISGANAGDFSITSQPGATVGANASTNFIVRFNPSATGVRRATVTIASNDSNEATYSFAIQGSGTVAANQPPVAKVNGPYSSNEGSSASFSAAGSTDPNGNPLTYSWDINGDGTYGDASGVSPTLSWTQLQALGINDGKSGSVYNVRVRVSDGIAQTISSATTFTLNNVAPLANAGVDKSVTVGSPVTLTGSATDPAGAADPLSFAWIVKNGAGTQVASGTGASITFTPGAVGAYTATLTVTDGDGGSDTDAAQVNVTARGNLAPIANAGGAYVINEGSGLSLNAAGSSDPDGNPLTYSWDVNGDRVFGDTTGRTPSLSWTQLKALGITDGNATSVYAVKVLVSDGTVTIESPATSLTVNNVAPVANAGPDKSVQVGTGVILAGSATDPAGDADLLSYAWVVKNAANATVANGLGKNFTFTPGVAGTFTATLTVTDGDGGSDTDTATITATPPSTGVPLITRFILVNADTDADIMVLDPSNGPVTLNLATLPRQLNIRVEGNNITQSVRLSLDGVSINVERSEPYALFSDLRGDIKPGVFAQGLRTVVAKAYANDFGLGEPGSTRTLQLNVINAAPAATSRVTSLQLINTATGAVLKTLRMYDVLRLSQLPPSISIKATTTGSPTSVFFKVDKVVASPTAALTLGSHQITAFPVKGGVEGETLSLTIFIES